MIAKKKMLAVFTLLAVLLCSGIPAGAMYVPDYEKVTAQEIKYAEEFYRNLKIDTSQFAKGKYSVYIPKVDTWNYSVGVRLEKYDQNLYGLGYKDIYVTKDPYGTGEGPGGVTRTGWLYDADINAIRVIIASFNSGYIIANELWIYSKKDGTFRYLPYTERIYPSKDALGNPCWTNDNGLTVTKDGILVYMGTEGIHKPFSDVSKKHWAFNTINNVYKTGYIKGYSDGRFQPEGSITRAEFAAMLNRLLSDRYPAGRTADNMGIFDSFPAGHWAYNAVYGLTGYMDRDEALGIFGSRFEPDRQITREEVVAVVHAALKNHPAFAGPGSGTVSAKDLQTSRFPDGVEFSLRHGIVSGYPDGTFRPGGKITRAEAAAVLNRLMALVQS